MSSKRRKFYFFDIGVVHALQGINSLPELGSNFGDAFETFIFHELRSYIDYNGQRKTLNFWRTQTGVEVDFILDETVAIEVKATKLVDERDLRGLKAFAEFSTLTRQIVVSRDPHRRQIGNIEIWPYIEFLSALWNGDI